MRVFFLLLTCCMLWKNGSFAQARPQLQLGAKGFFRVRAFKSPKPGELMATHFRVDTMSPWVKIGFSGARLAPYLQSAPQAKDEFHRYRVNGAVSAGLAVAGLGCAVAALVTLGRSVFAIDRVSSGTHRVASNPLFWLGAEIAVVGSGAAFRYTAGKHLHKAVLIYNQAESVLPHGSTMSCYPVWQPRFKVFPEIGAGLCLSF